MIPWWAYLIPLAALGIVELVAIFNHVPGDTLSEYTWQAFLPAKGSPHWRLRRFLLLGILFWGGGWLAIHLLSGGAF